MMIGTTRRVERAQDEQNGGRGVWRKELSMDLRQNNDIINFFAELEKNAMARIAPRNFSTPDNTKNWSSENSNSTTKPENGGRRKINDCDTANLMNSLASVLAREYNPMTAQENSDCTNNAQENNAQENNANGSNDIGITKRRMGRLSSMEATTGDVMAAVAAVRQNNDYIDKSNADGTIDVIRRAGTVQEEAVQVMAPQRRRRRRRRSITKSDNHKLRSMADFVNANNDDCVRLLEIAMTPFEVCFFFTCFFYLYLYLHVYTSKVVTCCSLSVNFDVSYCILRYIAEADTSSKELPV